MEKYFKILQSCVLFDDIKEDDIKKMLLCLNACVKTYKKDSAIIVEEDNISSVGVVLSGSVLVVKEDYYGNKTILAKLLESEIFAETFACAGVIKSPVTVLSVTACEILFIDYSKIITTCQSVCIFHTKIVENMLKIIANKNIMLNEKIELISKRTTREKLLTYFHMQIKKTKEKSFNISMSRQELADFLCVDRSAMSRELCKMRDEGVLKFKGSLFEILEDMEEGVSF